MQHRQARRKGVLLQGMVICGRCGACYDRYTGKERDVTWRCRGRYRKKPSRCQDGAKTPAAEKCQGLSVHESVIQGAVITALNRLPKQRSNIEKEQEKYQSTTYQDFSGHVSELDAKIARLQDAIRDSAPDTAQAQLEKLQKEKEDYLKEKAALGLRATQLQSLYRLMDAIENKPRRKHSAASGKVPCTTIADFYVRTDRITQKGRVLLFDEWLVKRFVDRIIVHDKSLDVVFIAGIKIRIQQS